MRNTILTAAFCIGTWFECSCTAPSFTPPGPRVEIDHCPEVPWTMPVTTDIAAVLDAKCPLDAPVLITVKPVKGRWGESWYDGERYQITVGPRGHSHPDFFADVLRHEWAHCLTDCDCESAHCEHWGANYARCYRATIED